MFGNPGLLPVPSTGRLREAPFLLPGGESQGQEQPGGCAQEHTWWCMLLHLIWFSATYQKLSSLVCHVCALNPGASPLLGVHMYTVLCDTHIPPPIQWPHTPHTPDTSPGHPVPATASVYFAPYEYVAHRHPLRATLWLLPTVRSVLEMKVTVSPGSDSDHLPVGEAGMHQAEIVALA